MAELFGQRMGRDILFGSRNYARDVAWNEADHPRGQPGNAGEFGPGGGAASGGGGGEGSDPAKPGASNSPSSATAGVVAKGEKNAADWRDEVTRGSPIRTIDDVLAATEVNQVSLGKLGERIGKAEGAEFRNPGAKKRDRLEEKLARPGRTPARITDAVRAGFNVTRAAQADEIVASLAKEYPVADEGWKITDVGYFDRKVMIKFPNGQMGEVQIWHPDMLKAKEEGGGHTHYEAMQKLPLGDPRREREASAMRQIYHGVLETLSQDWRTELGKAGS